MHTCTHTHKELWYLQAYQNQIARILVNGVRSDVCCNQRFDEIIESFIVTCNAYREACVFSSAKTNTKASTSIPALSWPVCPHVTPVCLTLCPVNDTLDDIFDASGDEEESEDIVTQVLDEIGIEISGKVRNWKQSSIFFPANIEVKTSKFYHTFYTCN